MAGEKVSNYNIGDVNLSALMTATDAQRIGYHAASLTEYDTDVKPEIAAGSKVEVNGALFKFDSDETITETPSDGDVYVKLIPDGTSITAEFTNDVPTWDDEKQGWYEASTNNRYLEFGMEKSGTDYSDKYAFYGRDALRNLYDYKFEKYTMAANSTGTKTFTFTFGFNVSSIVSLNFMDYHVSVYSSLSTQAIIVYYVNTISITDNVVTVSVPWQNKNIDQTVNMTLFCSAKN